MDQSEMTRKSLALARKARESHRESFGRMVAELSDAHLAFVAAGIVDKRLAGVPPLSVLDELMSPDDDGGKNRVLDLAWQALCAELADELVRRHEREANGQAATGHQSPTAGHP